MASTKSVAKTTIAAVTQQKPKFSEWVNSASAQKAIANTLQDPKRRQRFISSLVTAVTSNPALQECTFASILSASLLGESLNLSHSPQLGQFYLVPFKNKKEGESTATFVLGYKGYVQLALRSGYYKRLNVLCVKEGELVKYDPLNEDIEINLIEDANERENAKTIGYVASFEYMNGFRKTIYWSKEKMIAHADKYSPAFSKDGSDFKTSYGVKHKVSYAEFEAGNYPKGDSWMYSSFWYQNFDMMAQKTMLRQLISQWGIMSTELETAYMQDVTNDVDSGGGDSADFIMETDPFGASADVVAEQTVDASTGEVQEAISMDDL